MTITVKTSKKAWTSPDGKITIFDLTDQDGNQWQTRSKAIGEGIGQTFDCTTTISSSNKTYLIQTPNPNSPYASPQPAQTALPSQPDTGLVILVERLEAAVERLEKLAHPMTAAKVTSVLGGEVVDDLTPIESYE